MYCTKCGKKILDDAKFCQYCGHTQGSKRESSWKHAQSGQGPADNRWTYAEDNTANGEHIPVPPYEPVPPYSSNRSSDRRGGCIIAAVIATFVGLMLLIVLIGCIVWVFEEEGIYLVDTQNTTSYSEQWTQC